MARPHLSNRNWLRVPNGISGNYCVKCVTGLKDFVDVSGKLKSLNPSPVLTGKDLSVTSKRKTVNLHVNSCQSCSFCKRVSTEERCKSQLLLSLSKNKVIKLRERCFLCRSLEFCKSCHKCPNCCSKSTCRGPDYTSFGRSGQPRGQPQSGNST